METILVTGGCGYIGSHVSAYLLANGFNVLIIDSLVNSDENTILKLRKISNSQRIKSQGKLSFKKGDLKNRKFLDKVFNEYEKKRYGRDCWKEWKWQDNISKCSSWIS